MASVNRAEARSRVQRWWARIKGEERIWAVLVLGVLLSVGAFLSAWFAQNGRDQAVFQRRVAQFSWGLQERRNAIEDLLRTLRALFHLNHDLSRGQFRETIQDLSIRLAGVQALAWAPRVKLEERAAFEARVSQELLQDESVARLSPFRITEGDITHVPNDQPVVAGTREDYFPVVYFEPVAPNEQVLGYDTGSVPQVRSAIDRSRTRGGISVSGNVGLLHEGQIKQACVAVIPVYARDFIPATAEERDRQIQGVILAVVILPEMLKHLISQAGGLELDVAMVDRTDPSGPRVMEAIFPSGHAGEERAAAIAALMEQPSHVEPMAIGGRDWSVAFRRSRGWKMVNWRGSPFVVLIGGFFLTGLLAQNLRGALRRTKEVEELVEKRTAELATANSLLQAEVRDRKQAQTDLARDRYLLRTLIDRLPDAVFVTDGHGRYLAMNEAHRRLVQVEEASEIRGRSVGDVGPSDLAAFLDQGVAGVLALGKEVLAREQRLSLSGAPESILVATELPLFGEGRQVEGVVVIVRDVTAARVAAQEKQELERGLQETQKLESLGLLAGGIAHDFNNLLTGVLGNVGLARMDLPPGSTAIAYLDQIQSAAFRAAELCRQMLAYSGKGRFVVSTLDLSELVEETTELLRLSISRKAELKLELGRGLLAVSGDGTQLRQILMNLVMNASDALGEGPGWIRVRTGMVKANRTCLEGAVLGAGLKEGDYAFLEVADNGCGISPDVMKRIFEPFFTTKFTGRGLGLSAVLGIARGHQGALLVDSVVGKGTSFRLLLPTVDDKVASSALPSGRVHSGQGSGKVLLADDEEVVRAVTKSYLQRFGFEVCLAANGREAVEVFAADPSAFSLVMLDLTMPELDGQKAFTEMRRLRPDVCVVLMSGYTAAELKERFGESAPSALMQKPFSGEELKEVLSDLLPEGVGM